MWKMRLNESIELSYVSGGQDALGKKIGWIAKPENK
jgi:hypothetical protein|tara:strand:- start:652 stop:759 length:108 start_codon:yes stop_codon:yes gene_type:complete